MVTSYLPVQEARNALDKAVAEWRYLEGLNTNNLRWLIELRDAKQAYEEARDAYAAAAVAAALAERGLEQAS